MTYLVVTLCLLSDPGICQTEKFALFDATMLTCVSVGQAVVPGFVEQRSGTFAKRWKCESMEE